MAKAWYGHLANPEHSTFREELIHLGARVRIIEESLHSLRRGAPPRPPRSRRADSIRVRRPCG